MTRLLRALPCLLLLAAPALAEVTERSALTLGALTDGCHRVVLARVAGLLGEQVQLEVLDLVKGRAAPLLTLPRGGLTWAQDEQALLFLDEGLDGAPRPPRSAWHKIVVPDAAARAHLLEVVRGRLPSLGGDPRALGAALFAQLGSPLPRVREDAALELLAWRELDPGPAERAALREALAREPRLELLELAARLPEAALLAPALAAARGARDARTRELASAALRAIDPVAALAALADDLRAGGKLVAASSAQLLGALGGAEAERLLAGALQDPRPEVRQGALLGFAAAARIELTDPAPLLAVARGADPAAARRALAILARGAQGAALRQLEAGLEDPALRALAARLRADPVEAAREVLGD